MELCGYRCCCLDFWQQSKDNGAEACYSYIENEGVACQIQGKIQVGLVRSVIGCCIEKLTNDWLIWAFVTS